MKKLTIGLIVITLTACSHGERSPLRTDSAAGNVSLETSPAAPASGVNDSTLARRRHP
jgi:hypothetical protein